MKILKGVSASSGIVEGMACCYMTQEESEVQHYAILKEQIPSELVRAETAFREAKKKMLHAMDISKGMFNKQTAEIFNAHRMMLEDKQIKDRILSFISEKKVNAEHAVLDVFSDYTAKFGKGKTHFEEMVHDVVDVRNRLLEGFGAGRSGFSCRSGYRQPVVVVSKRFNPSMILNIPRENILAFVTEEGGYTSHATILARSFGVPVIFGIDVEKHLKCRDKVIVDAHSGRVIISPDAGTKRYYRDKIARLDARKHICNLEINNPARLKTGSRISLKINVNNPLEMDVLQGAGYDGVGLLRTEFLFMKRDTAPTEEEQVDMYKKILSNAEGKPVVARMLDIDAEKVPPYLRLPDQINPDLGIRGPRAVEFFRDIFITQAKAFMRAAKYGDLKILYPMVSDPADISIFKLLFRKAAASLRLEKKEFRSEISFGVMIETPSAALMAEDLLAEADFANIGSNDLLQYTLAFSRDSSFVEKNYHILHPSLVRLMEIVVDAGKKMKKEICLCGEISSFEEFYPFLDVGLRSFSVSVSSFNEVKCSLLYADEPGNGKIIKSFYRLKSKKAIDRFFRKFN